MKNSMPDIVVVLYTYNRVNDAKINQEIIRELWRKSGLFGNIKIVHAYNGETSWYPEPYHEDLLIRRRNLGHYAGAGDLIDAGLLAARKKYPNIQYGVVLAADTWAVKPEYVARIINQMKQTGLLLSSCPWGLPGLEEFRIVGAATDFFILDLAWASKYKMIPIDYAKFHGKFAELVYYHSGNNIMLEKLTYSRYINALFRETRTENGLQDLAQAKLCVMEERRPIHNDAKLNRTHAWPKIGLYSYHDTESKQKLVQKLKLQSEAALTLAKSKKLDYYFKP